MDSLKEQRRQSFNSFFATISVLLSIAHFIVLGLSVSFAQEYNDAMALVEPKYSPNFFVHMNVPFAVAMGILGAVQLLSCVMIISFNRSAGGAKKIHFACAAGAIASLVAGTLVTTTAIYINYQIQTWTTSTLLLTSFDSFYMWLEVDATANCLLSVPSIFFVFYSNIDNHLKQSSTKQPIIKSDLWVLSVGFNAIAHTIFYLIYIWIQKEDETSQDHLTQSQYSRYIFFVIVEIIVSILVLVALLLHFQPLPFGKSHIFKSWMTTKQLILAVTIAAQFSFAVFFIIIIKAIQIGFDLSDNPTVLWYSYFRSNYKNLMIQLYIFSVLTLCTIGVLIAKFRDLSSSSKDDDQSAGPLLSSGLEGT